MNESCFLKIILSELLELYDTGIDPKFCLDHFHIVCLVPSLCCERACRRGRGERHSRCHSDRAIRGMLAGSWHTILEHHLSTMPPDVLPTRDLVWAAYPVQSLQAEHL